MKCQKQVVFYSGGSRPSDWGGGGGGSQKNLFSVLRASVSSRYKAKGGGRGGGRGPPLDPPLFSAFIISFG